jgi:manganese/zinc/iron transport system permease protein
MFHLDIILVASVTAIACALPGVILILRKNALITDAISHSLLPGIVIMFLVIQSFEMALTPDTTQGVSELLNSPLLILGAALTGILLVVLVEWIQKSPLVNNDSAIALIFPALFSIGIILISQELRDVHLDLDMVLVGDLTFAPLDRFIVDGIDLGPRNLWVMSVLTLVNVLFIGIFYKEISLSTFDEGLAKAKGFKPKLLNYILMFLVSITAVGAFDSAGSILVIALFIVPGAGSYLLTNKVHGMMLISVAIAILSAASGYGVAYALNAATSGTMALMTGVIFLLIYLFAPNRGFLAVRAMRKRQKVEFATAVLMVHLTNHENDGSSEAEYRTDHLKTHISWTPYFADQIIKRSEQEGLIQCRDGIMHLTEEGRELGMRAKELRI